MHLSRYDAVLFCENEATEIASPPDPLEFFHISTGFDAYKSTNFIFIRGW